MKKGCLFLSLMLFAFGGFAQHFEDYFEDKTLRINYLHTGGQKTEEFNVISYHAGGEWTGTREFLLDPRQYGNILFEVYDSISNKLIFSRSYCTLFDEYKTTERAEKEIGSFEECVLMPFPQKSIKYTFTSISRKLEKKVHLTGYFNPAKSAITPFKKEFKVTDLYIGGKSKEALDILFIPDGYSKKDKKKMKDDMERFASYITECSPFKEYGGRVNIRAIEGYSKESGITDPGMNMTKNTLLNSTYNVLDVDRYLMCLHVWRMNEIADDAPYDAIVIICNSKKYGGGGIYNFYATVNSDHDRSGYVIVHELGHSIGGLGDEYYTSEVSVRDYYPEGIEPLEPNLTTLVDFDSKWKRLMGTNKIPTPDTEEYSKTVGVFEGGGYVANGVYRPYRSCTMKDGIYNYFCPVCTKTLQEAFIYYSNIVLPTESNPVKTNQR